jgi:hypothetical protein
VPAISRPVRPQNRVLWFFLALLLYCALFAYFTLDYGLFFRRIGFESLSERSLNMPIYALVVHRSFMENAVTLLCTGLLLLMTVQLSRLERICAVLMWLPTLAFYLCFVLANNRFQSAILMIGLYVTLGYGWLRIKRKRVEVVAVAFVFAALTIYSFRLTENIRDELYIQGCVHVSVANPFENPVNIYQRVADNPKICSTTGYTDTFVAIHQLATEKNKASLPNENTSAAIKAAVNEEVARPVDRRLNGLALIAQITGPALESGFGKGQFWIDPASLYYNYIFDRAKYREIKEQMRTNPKVYIVKHYLGEHILDSPSSILTDLYANFSFLGFIVAGLVLGLGVGWTDLVLRHTTSAGAAVLAFFLMEKCLYVEKEFFGFTVDLLKFSVVPIIAAVWLWRVALSARETQTLVSGAEASAAVCDVPKS